MEEAMTVQPKHQWLGKPRKAPATLPGRSGGSTPASQVTP
jgi:hypothetical protein